MTLTREEADKLVNMEKVVISSMDWESTANGQWRFEAKAVSVDNNEVFVLRGYIGHINYSFTLLYQNIPIRKYTKHNRHRFKGKDYTEPHKHVWDEKTEDKEVYIPTDIKPDDNLDYQFLDFCKECNTNVSGYQMMLFEEKRK